MSTSREWHLVRRPQGLPTADDFQLVQLPLPRPGADELLVRNLVLSVDPAMRLRMNDASSYTTPFELDRPMHASAIGRVESSRFDGIPRGTVVRHSLGLREWAVLPAASAEVIHPGTEGVPVSAYLGVLGWPGLAAWVGLYDIADIRPSQTLFVSAASGATGNVAGQLAKLAGLRVIGSAGSAEKVRWLYDLGFDAAFNYRNGRIAEQLAEYAPHGIDYYFDNVGGDHLAAALSCLNPFGRIAVCGMIPSYNRASPGPDNLFQIVAKKLSVRGFIVSDHAHRKPVFHRHVVELIRGGGLRIAETRRRGIEQAVPAFLDLLRGGRHLGKMVIDLA